MRACFLKSVFAQWFLLQVFLLNRMWFSASPFNMLLSLRLNGIVVSGIHKYMNVVNHDRLLGWVLNEQTQFSVALWEYLQEVLMRRKDTPQEWIAPSKSISALKKPKWKEVLFTCQSLLFASKNIYPIVAAPSIFATTTSSFFSLKKWNEGHWLSKNP